MTNTGDSPDAGRQERPAIAFACGGTGGHIFPALAVAEAVCRLNPQVQPVFVGVGGEIESRLIGPYGYPLEQIPFVQLTGKGIAGAIKAACVLPRSLASGLKLFRRIRPRAVIGFGGYPSCMPLVVGRLLGIPCALQEQNVQVGNANRLLSRLCRSVFAVEGAKGFRPGQAVQFLPNPVRSTFFEIAKWQEPAAGERLVVLVVGGSQGAVTLNDAVLELLPLIKELDLSVVHQAGRLDFERVESRYREAGVSHYEVQPFFDNIVPLYARAHLVICRAGAMTAAEVCAAGRPAIYVPLKIAQGHQIENVRRMESAGAALIFEHGADLVANLAGALRELTSNPGRLSQMSEAASGLSRVGDRRESSAAVIACELLSMARLLPDC